jgi:ferredoxin
VKITIDEEKCCAAGQCVLSAPDVFDQRDEDGIVVVLDASPPESQRAAIEEAAELCPAAVIHIEG